MSEVQKIINEFFLKKSHKNLIAQGTIEYLVIIAVVIVLSLIVVGIVLQNESGANISENSTEIALQAGLFSIKDRILSIDGNGAIVLSNNSIDAITIKNIIVDGNENNFSNKIYIGESKGFLLTNITNCNSINEKKTIELTIIYETIYGLEKTATFNNVDFGCMEIINPLINLIGETSSEDIDEQPISEKYAFFDSSNFSDGYFYYTNQGPIYSNGTLDWNSLQTYPSSFDQNLILYYKFDSLNNGKVVDVSQNSGDATLVNNANISKKGFWDSNALYLNGSGYLEIPDVRNSEDFTYITWIKMKDLTNYSRLIDIGPLGYTQNLSLFVYPDTAFRVNSKQVVYSGTLEKERWYHLAATYNHTTTTGTIYLNGIAVASDSDMTDLPSSINPINKYIGRSNGGDTYLNAELDELKIYNRPLSPTEIMADFNAWLDANYMSPIIDTTSSSTQFDSITFNSDSVLYGKEISLEQETQFNNSLVGLWHFNETQTPFLDSSSNNNNCSCSACPSTDNTGIFHNALTFSSASSQYLSCGNDSSLNITNAITLSAWVKHTTGSPSTYENILVKGNTTYGFQFNTAREFMFKIYTNTYKLLSSLTVPTVDEWYHIVGTYDGSTQKIYVNGSLKNTAMFSGTINSTNDNLSIGEKIAGDNAYLNASLDEIAIWSRALTDDEVKKLYNKGATKIGLKYRGCVDSTGINCSNWLPQNIDGNIDLNTPINISELNENNYRYFQYALLPRINTAASNHLFYETMAKVEDVNFVYTN